MIQLPESRRPPMTGPGRSAPEDARSRDAQNDRANHDLERSRPHHAEEPSFSRQVNVSARSTIDLREFLQGDVRLGGREDVQRPRRLRELNRTAEFVSGRRRSLHLLRGRP